MIISDFALAEFLRLTKALKNHILQNFHKIRTVEYINYKFSERVALSQSLSVLKLFMKSTFLLCTIEYSICKKRKKLHDRRPF